MLEKHIFVSHTKHTQRKINGSISFAIDNMYYANFRIQEQMSVPWCDEILLGSKDLELMYLEF